MSMKFALAGNPNSGKTTLFNALTGSTQYVGNWPGVTVEKKEGKLRGASDIILTDLPGIYSLSPYTLEEVITREYVIAEHPSVIINIVDASNLERNLYLTTQVMELGVPVVVALNMMDVVERRGDKIDAKKLSTKLGVPVMPISAAKGTGIKELVAKAREVGEASASYAAKLTPISFEETVEEAIADVKSVAEHYAAQHKMNPRWLAIKLLEHDEKIVQQIHLSPDEKKTVDAAADKVQKQYGDEFESVVTDQRYQYITSIENVLNRKARSSKLTVSDKIDRIVTNRILGLPIFFGVMWLIYYIAITTVGDWFIGWIETLFGEIIGGNLAAGLESIGTNEFLISLLVDGIIAGVGAVLTFVPQMMIMFFFLALLEDCGYMARVAFIMDRIFRRFGLSGKSFIPMIIGMGCSVPGIMASRTIENDKDRKMTIMLTPFVPCGAKLPIFTLLIAAFFPEQPWMFPLIYLIGILMVIIGGIFLKHTVFRGEPAPFVMELPEYRLPRARNVLGATWERGSSFIIRAGTIILAVSVVIWFLQGHNWQLQAVDAEESILHSLGSFIAPLFAPLGFGDWKASFAVVTGLLAKETVVATFGILYGVGEVDPEAAGEALQLHEALRASGVFTNLSALSFMIFNLFAAPCMAAIGAIKREMGSWKWTGITLLFQTGVAYVLALLVYQIGRLFVG